MMVLLAMGAELVEMGRRELPHASDAEFCQEVDQCGEDSAVLDNCSARTVLGLEVIDIGVDGLLEGYGRQRAMIRSIGQSRGQFRCAMNRHFLVRGLERLLSVLPIAPKVRAPD